MEETNTGAALPAKRPTFLTVLCILSFVGIAYSLIEGIWHYFELSQIASAGGDLFSDDMNTPNGEQIIQAIEAMGIDYGKLVLNTLVVTLLNIPILIGVLMMWKQKKMGFYVYTAVELIQCVMPFILILGGGVAGGILGVLCAVYAIVAIVFIILYGMNLKHMA